MDKLLIFDLWGDYAHFKKHYTTTSPLSFPFPPRTTIAGIISCLIGLDKKEYLAYFGRDFAWISVRLLAPVKKIRLGQNLIDTKKGFFNIKQRTQIRIEYIKDPKYRIYFYHSNPKEIYQPLKRYLENHQSVYTVSLGLSGLLANFSFIGEYPLHKISSQDSVEIDSVVPSGQLSGRIEFEEGKEYFSVNIPIEMQKGRVVTNYGEVNYERNGKKILCQPDSYYEVENGEKILFL
ncbi:type I-B CRISPR-associated protein Cas5b [bacterium]|nr:type I-B CRISPR-associated protein Cas5b [bacterium]